MKRLLPDDPTLLPEEMKASLIASTLGLTTWSVPSNYDGSTIYLIRTARGHELNRSRFIKTIIACLDTLVSAQRVFGSSYLMTDSGEVLR
jgi:hypothetical protein